MQSILPDYNADFYFCGPVPIEALTNIRKYAEVQEATVLLYGKNSVITVIVKDKGKGFNHDQHSHGVGIFSMEERAKAIGGTLKVDSELRKGTTVLLQVPVLGLPEEENC